MSYAEEYKKKLTTPEEAVKVVRGGDWIDYGSGYEAGRPGQGPGWS